MSRIRRLGFAAIMIVAMLVGGAPAFANEPLTTSGHVTDPDGFLSDEQRETIETPAKSFYSTYTTYIDVVIVPNFSARNHQRGARTPSRNHGLKEKASSTLSHTRMVRTSPARVWS